MTDTGQVQEGMQQSEGCQTVLQHVLPMLAAQPRLVEALHLRPPCSLVKDLMPAKLDKMSQSYTRSLVTAPDVWRFTPDHTRSPEIAASL